MSRVYAGGDTDTRFLHHSVIGGVVAAMIIEIGQDDHDEGIGVVGDVTNGHWPRYHRHPESKAAFRTRAVEPSRKSPAATFVQC